MYRKLFFIAALASACTIEDVDYYAGTGESTATMGSFESSSPGEPCSGLACDVPDADVNSSEDPQAVGAYCGNNDGDPMTPGLTRPLCRLNTMSVPACMPGNCGCPGGCGVGESPYCFGCENATSVSWGACPNGTIPEGTIRCNGCDNDGPTNDKAHGWWWDADGNCTGTLTCGGGGSPAGVRGCAKWDSGVWEPVGEGCDNCGG